ncbi:Uncharacterised protein [Vibrio cholerae]|nr:Uncharacterised protein [Vibrio cholerae]
MLRFLRRDVGIKQCTGCGVAPSGNVSGLFLTLSVEFFFRFPIGIEQGTGRGFCPARNSVFRPDVFFGFTGGVSRGFYRTLG